MILYNEIEPFPAQWLRNLSDAGHIAKGTIDDRSITELAPTDVAGARQFHTFAGIGAWSYALRLAGWPDDRPVWTGSCPCQPFSVAGRRKGASDERHLWPAWFRLISECRPPTIFGEQVASPDGRAWLAAVSADLESLGYAVAGADLCAASVGAPHVRQRLYFVAHAHSERRNEPGRFSGQVPEASRSGEASDLGHADHQGLERFRESKGQGGRSEAAGHDTAPSFWSGAEWLGCTDGKARPTEPGTFPLDYGAPGRVGRLRAYGNAIVPQVAAQFIRASVTDTAQ